VGHASYPVFDNPDQARLPDPRLTAQEDDLAGPLGGLRRRSKPTSSSRPTKGVSPVVAATSSRLRVSASSRTWNAPTDALERLGSEITKPEQAVDEALVAALITTVLGSAIA
jgi:hypothetical protein